MKIFISYRRADSEGVTARIRDRLVARYGDDSVFTDIDNIPFGKDSRQHINDALVQSNIVIAIVGPLWLGADSGGRARIHADNDPVRIEIELAQQMGIPIIPVLVGNTTMPASAVLPDAIKDFVFLNAAQVDPGRDFHLHMERLARSVDETVSNDDASPHAAAVSDRLARSSGPELKPAGKPDVAASQILALPDKPSIAVLPFTSIGGDPEQEYFADGMAEEIITALSRMRWLFVIARNSTFTYKGRSVDVKQVGRELGVRYVLEGSVRKAANRVRITGELVDAATGGQIWADRFDGGFEDIFDLQDRVTARVVSAISPKLVQAEIQRAKRKPCESLDAYDVYLRGLAYVHEWTRESNDVGLRLFRRAIELDPDFASAYGMAAFCYVQRKANRWMIDRTEEIAEGSRLARKAVDLGKDDADALCWGGFALAYLAGDVDAGRVFVDRALQLNPNLALAWDFSGWLSNHLGEPEKALAQFAQVTRLSPFDPHLMPNVQVGIALAYFIAGDYDKAASLAEQELRERPNFQLALRFAIASNALAGRLDDAKREMARLLEIDPLLRVSDLWDLTPLSRPGDRERYETAMSNAGLPQ